MSKTIRDQVQESYERALDSYLTAAKELEGALRALHKEGIYPGPLGSIRFKLDDERQGTVRKCAVGMGDHSVEFYIQTGNYTGGFLGEIFLTANKMGSLESGLMDALAIVMSLALQYGVPLERLVSKLKFMKFEPSGMTRNAEIPMVDSVVDYVVKYLELKYLKEEEDGEPAGGEVV